jgi:hypothetical protein
MTVRYLIDHIRYSNRETYETIFLCLAMQFKHAQCFFLSAIVVCYGDQRILVRREVSNDEFPPIDYLRKIDLTVSIGILIYGTLKALEFVIINPRLEIKVGEGGKLRRGRGERGIWVGGLSFHFFFPPRINPTLTQ